jgi:hypothetical protein
MRELYKTEHHIAFVPDGRFIAKKNGYLVAVRWQDCTLLGYPEHTFVDYQRYTKAAVKLWGPAYTPVELRRYYITQARNDGRRGRYWTYTMYLKSEKDLTILTLGVE